jgi:transporter family protein
MDLLWVPFSIATIMMYGLGQVFAKETRTKGSSANLLLLLSVNIFVMWAAYWLLFRKPGSFGMETWLQAIGAAALSGAAYVTYYESIKRGKVSIVGTIAGAYAPLTVFLAIIFLGEKMTAGELAGVVLVVAAMLVFTYSTGNNGNGTRKSEMLGIAFAILSLIFWGTSAAMAKGVITEMGDTNFIGVYALVCPAIWLVYWMGSTKGKFEMPESNRWLLELSLLCFAAGGITLYLAIDFGNVSIVSPVTNLYPLVTIAVAKMRLREQLSTRQIAALAMLIAAVPLLSL